MATSSSLERKDYPSDARALVIRIPQAHLDRMLSGCSRPEPSNRLELEPISHVDSRVRRLVGILTTELRKRQPAQALLTEGVAEALLALLIEHNDEPKVSRRVRARKALSGDLTRLSEEFVDERLHQPPSLELWSRYLGLSKAAFVRVFRHTNGVTPYAWLMDRRIERARVMLRDTAMSLSEIALEVGFSDQSHFTDAFSRRVGVSPGRWRLDERAR